MIQFGMRCHDLCPKQEMLKVLDEVKAHNIHHIQLAMSKSFSDYDTSYGHYSAGFGNYIGEELRKRDIHVAILGCYINPVTPDKDARMREVDRFIEHLKYAKRMGADMVGTETGRFSIDMKPTPLTATEECYKTLVDSFERIVDAAERLGVTVGVEGVHNHTLQTPELMKRFLDDMASPALEVIFDACNMMPQEAKTAEAQDTIIKKCFDLYGDRISVLHLKDYLFEPGNECQSFRRPGHGIFHYNELMKQVRANKPMIIGLLEDSSPETYEADCAYLQARYDEAK